MNESVLNALIHLFAIVAAVNRRKMSSVGREIVANYLRRYLNEELTEDYMKVFDNYHDFYTREIRTARESGNKLDKSLITFQITNVCHQIRKGLLRDERIIVFIQLLAFVNEDHRVTVKEREFISIVARGFSISDNEFSNIRAFILEDDIVNIEKNKLLVLDNQVREWSEDIAWFMTKKTRQISLGDFMHIYVENLYGRIVVLHIASINAFIFKYQGQLNLYFESKKIIPGRTYFMKSGSIIKGPNIKPIYLTRIAGKYLQGKLSTPIYLSVDDVEFRFKGSVNGIHRFRFFAQSGEMVAIMGGSGVGKSTLLNILIGKQPPGSGRILINGYDVYRNRNALHGIIGYVPQDDLLIEELTVFSNLYYNARLCFRDYDEDKILAVVNAIMNDLDLTEVQHLKVGNPLNKFISGGQRKRLNIALELMREPSLLFVDEPTSGLSSQDSLKVVQLLKKQTFQGRIIVANIHQPSSDIFKLFDKLIILDRGGYPVFSGNPLEAIGYFKKISAQVNAADSECPACGHVNPDQILEIIEAKTVDEFGDPTPKRKIEPGEWYDIYRKSIEPEIKIENSAEPLPESRFSIPRKREQFKVFFTRNLLAKLTDKQYVLINLLESPLLALILGYFTKYMSDGVYIFGENKNLPVFLFMSVVVALFLGLTVSAEEIIKDRRILERESFLNLDRPSYLNAKILFLFGLSAIQTLTFILMASPILEIKGMILRYWIILFSTACFGNMVGLNISAGLKSVVAIYIMIPLILVPQLLLGGAMIRFDDIHPRITNKKYVPFIGDLMTTRWAYEALAVTQFKDNRFEKHFFEVDQKISTSNYYNSLLIPRLQNLVEEIAWNREFGKETEPLINNNLAIIRKEFVKLEAATGQPPFEYLNYLNADNYSETVAEAIFSYLYLLKLNVQGTLQRANQERDSIYNGMISRLGRDGFESFRKQYHNTSLADIVRSNRETIKLIVTGDEIIRKTDPVFMMPESDFGRTQFFAPAKMINGRHIDTLLFNVVFIWFTSSLLYFTLWFDSLRKLLGYFELIQFRRRLKKTGKIM